MEEILMTANERKLLEYIKAHPKEVKLYDGMLTYYQDEIAHGQAEYHRLNKEFRNLITTNIRMFGKDELDKAIVLHTAYKKSLFLDAKTDFDAYCLYIESNRRTRSQFYLPRRKVLGKVASDLQSLANGGLDILTISLPPGVGKALANDTQVLTRNGWKNHGDLVVGDEVIGIDGEFKKVIAVHPKCMLDRVVTFTNGEKIVCHERHEWTVHNRQRPDIQYMTLETGEIEKKKLEVCEAGCVRGHRYNIQLPLREKVKGEEKKLPLDPYTFGVWLGDGDNTNPTISSPVFDRFVMFKIMRNGINVCWHTQHKDTKVMYYGLRIRKELQSMGMCYSRKTTTKHIPEEYLTASFEQRLELLAGLIDTDGTLCGSKYQFSTTEPALRDSFVELVSTFGWRTCVSKHEPRVSSSGVVGRKTVYVISFTPDIEIPCVLERKRNKYPHKQRTIAIKSIEKCEPVEGNCITVEGDGLYLAGRTMLPTHNSTLALFFITWLGGLHPDKAILTFSHDAGIVRGFYDEVLRIISPDGEYLYRDVFPMVDVPLVGTNAKELRIDLGKSKRFETFQFSSVGAGNAGKYRASELLYCDDLCSGIEEAMSKDRMDKLWRTYSTDIRQRTSGDPPELHIATRWSVWDVIGRLERKYMDNPTARAKFITIPALDENGQSNFDYPMTEDRFTTERYYDLRDTMDDVDWRAIYMNQPIEREGQLYHPDDLRRFFDLPDRDPDAIVAICDNKEKGSDYAFMPIIYIYGRDCYVADCICDNGDPGIVEERLARKLVEHKVQMAQFESNSAGWHIAQHVQKRVDNLGGITKITTKTTTSNKETKIVVNAPAVKERFLFLDSSKYKARSDYGKAMAFLTGYTLVGKNKHDDVPDGMAMAALYIESFNASKVEILRRPF